MVALAPATALSARPAAGWMKMGGPSWNSALRFSLSLARHFHHLYLSAIGAAELGRASMWTRARSSRSTNLGYSRQASASRRGYRAGLMERPSPPTTKYRGRHGFARSSRDGRRGAAPQSQQSPQHFGPRTPPTRKVSHFARNQPSKARPSSASPPSPDLRSLTGVRLVRRQDRPDRRIGSLEV